MLPSLSPGIITRPTTPPPSGGGTSSPSRGLTTTTCLLSSAARSGNYFLKSLTVVAGHYKMVLPVGAWYIHGPCKIDWGMHRLIRINTERITSPPLSLIFQLDKNKQLKTRTPEVFPWWSWRWWLRNDYNDNYRGCDDQTTTTTMHSRVKSI